jgi:hypothetical protein
MAFGGQVNKVVNYTWRFTDADKMQGAMQGISRAAGAAVIAIGGAMTALTISSVKAASAFVEMENQFAVVFGEAAPRARAELDLFAESIGRSSNRMMGYAAAIQDTFVPLGVARDEAAALSVQAVQLATDLSSFKNIDMEDTVTSITAALAGQHRSVQRLGIVIRESTLDQELWNMGIEGGFRAATEAEKVIARYNLMVAASSDALGDSQRTSEEFENQLRVLDDAWYDLRVEIGQEVIPIIEDLIPEVLTLMGDFKEFAVEAIPAVIENLKDLAPTILEIMGLLVRFGNVITVVAEGWQKLTRDSTAELRTFAAGMNAELESAMNWESILDDAALEGQRRTAQGIFDTLVSDFTTAIGTMDDAAEESIVLGGGTTGGGTTTDPPDDPLGLSKATQALTESLQQAHQLDLENMAAKQAMSDEYSQSELVRAQRLNDMYMSTAYNFGRVMRNDGEGLLDLVMQIGMEFAKMQLGKSVTSGIGGLGFSFLGGFF